jgi:hypothetical protein
MKQNFFIGMAFTFIGFFTLTAFIAPFENQKLTTSDTFQNKTYYVFGYAWGNGYINNKQENGSDGVAYVTDIASMRASDHYTGMNVVRSESLIQFKEEAEARYSKDIYYTYFSNGTSGVRVYNSYEEAENERRKAIAKYKSDGATVRYMNNFELYNK